MTNINYTNKKTAKKATKKSAPKKRSYSGNTFEKAEDWYLGDSATLFVAKFSQKYCF